jgi:predicted dehydrogenase
MMLRSLVVGYGSIGTRHTRVLEQLDSNVAIVSRRGEAGGRACYSSIAQAIAANLFDYVVVANETALHMTSLRAVADAGYEGVLLVEKPLSAMPEVLPRHRFQRAGVGYNLRFHPVAEALRAALAGRQLQMAELDVGQWLADWRPGRDIGTTYSASRAGGGGVLRDLSHELDLATWLFGPWIRVAAMGGRLGNATIDSDDAWGILLECERCPLVTVQISSLDRMGRRTITVQSDGSTFRADLAAAALEIDGQTTLFNHTRDASFAAMHQAMIDGSSDVCSLEEGANVVRLIAAIESASGSRRWVERLAA